MATRSISVSDDVEAALAFLAKQDKVTTDDYFLKEVDKVFTSSLKDANEKRHQLISDAMKNTDKSAAVAKVRELLSA
jgi:hypothetical protein